MFIQFHIYTRKAHCFCSRSNKKAKGLEYNENPDLLTSYPMYLCRCITPMSHCLCRILDGQKKYLLPIQHCRPSRALEGLQVPMSPDSQAPKTKKKFQFSQLLFEEITFLLITVNNYRQNCFAHTHRGYGRNTMLYLLQSLHLYLYANAGRKNKAFAYRTYRHLTQQWSSHSIIWRAK